MTVSKRTRRALLGTIGFVGVVLGASPAFGDPGATDPVSAQLFFERGRDAAARGDASEACRDFEESLRYDLAVGTLFNLARCEEQLGRFASAWQHLREGLDRLEANDPRRSQAADAATALEPRVPHLEVRLAPGAKGRVFRDGVELASPSLGTPLPMNPGRHTLVVRAKGRADNVYDVDLHEGDQRTIFVAAGDAAALDAAASTSPLRTIGWIAGGTGLAALGIGLVSGAVAFGHSSVVDDHCDATHVCDQEGLDALSSAKTFGGIATVAVVASAVLVSAGVVCLLVGKGPTTTGATPPLVRF